MWRNGNNILCTNIFVVSKADRWFSLKWDPIHCWHTWFYFHYLVVMFYLWYLQIWPRGGGTTHLQLMKWQEWFASYPPSLKLWCVLYNCFPMFILLLLAPNVFMFDHYSPLRLEKYHKFLQGKQLCNPCLALVVSIT
jgi:hypothetical protein